MVGVMGGGEDLGTRVMLGVVQLGLVWGLCAVRRGVGTQPEKNLPKTILEIHNNKSNIVYINTIHTHGAF